MSTTEKGSKTHSKLIKEYLDHSGDAVYVIDPSTGQFMDVSNAAVDALQYSREELLNMKVRDIEVGLEFRTEEEWNQFFAEHDSTIPSFVIEGIHRRKDGTTFPVEVHANYFKGYDKPFIVSIVRDITDRKKAQEDLIRFRTIVDQAPDAMFIIHPEDGRLVDFNDTAQESLRYTRDELRQLKVKDIEVKLPTQTKKDWNKLAEQLKSTPGPTTLKGTHKRKDGSEYPVEKVFTYLEMGNESYFLSVVRDISENLQTRNELEQFRTIFNEAGYCIYIIDAETAQFLDANKKACELTQYSRDELLQMGVPDLQQKAPERTAEGWQKTIQDFNTTQKPKTIQGIHKRKDGTTFPVEIQATYSEVDGRGYVLAMIRETSQDVAKAKKLERFRNMIDQSSDTFFMIDPETAQFNDVNQTALEALQYTREEFLNLKVYEIAINPMVSDVESFRDMIKMLKSTGNAGRFEGFHRRKDGTVFPVEVAVSVNEFDGQKYVLAAGRDMSQKKEMITKLRAAKEQAEMANRAKTAFLTNVSHEIRTPLSAINGFIKVLMAEPGMSDKLKQYVEIISRNSNHLMSLIDGFLDLSKVELGEFGTEIQEMSPEKEIATAVSGLLPEIRRKDLNFTVKFNGSIPETMHSDPQIFRQILFNLLSNAVKYTEEGSIDMIIGCDWDNTDSATFAVHVIDTGVGIEKNTQNAIFQPFLRSKYAKEHNFEGSGLGLALSKKMAQHLGGDVCIIHSEQGKGSEFLLTLNAGNLTGVPMKKVEGDNLSFSPSTSEVPWTERVQGKLENKSILIAEDSEDLRLLLDYYLKTTKAKYEFVENGKLAVDVASSKSFDLVLMDIEMPEMNGYEATRTLRQNGFTKPIIALTAHALLDEKEKCLKAGCNDYLKKPISPLNLIETLEKYC